MTNALPAIAKTTHAELREFLAKQAWPYWAVNTNALEPLRAYEPVSLARLVRVLKSHYTFSDVYLFNAASSEAHIRAIDWQHIPSIKAEQLDSYVVIRTVGQPFLGIAGSYDAAQRGEVISLIPAEHETEVNRYG